MKNLLKAILKTGSGSIVSVLFGMVAIKLIASRLGAEALGSFSLIKQTIVAGSAMFVTGGQTALVQGMAVRHSDERRRFLGTTLVLLCGGSLFIGGTIAVIAPWLGPRLFPDARVELLGTVRLAGAAVAVAGPAAFVFGTLNGLRRIGRLAIAQSGNAVALAVLIWIALPRLGSQQPQHFALILACSQLLGLLLGGVFLLREKLELWSWAFDKRAARHFGNLAFATFAAATLQGWTVLAIRGAVSSRLGLRSAGIFDVGWTISMVYVMLVLGSFSTYYLPTLAATVSNQRKLINEVLRTSLLLVVPMVAAMITVRPMVVTLLYSPEFLPATRMMRWMLLGDFCKVISFVLAMPMIAFADTRAFLAGEVGWNLAMLGGTFLALRSGLGLESLGALFAASYLGYLAYAWGYCRRKLCWTLPQELIAPLMLSVAVLGAASVLSWAGTETSILGAGVVALGGVVLALLLLRSGKRDRRLRGWSPGVEA